MLKEMILNSSQLSEGENGTGLDEVNSAHENWSKMD